MRRILAALCTAVLVLSLAALAVCAWQASALDTRGLFYAALHAPADESRVAFAHEWYPDIDVTLTGGDAVIHAEDYRQVASYRRIEATLAMLYVPEGGYTLYDVGFAAGSITARLRLLVLCAAVCGMVLLAAFLWRYTRKNIARLCTSLEDAYFFDLVRTDWKRLLLWALITAGGIAAIAAAFFLASFQPPLPVSPLWEPLSLWRGLWQTFTGAELLPNGNGAYPDVIARLYALSRCANAPLATGLLAAVTGACISGIRRRAGE